MKSNIIKVFCAIFSLIFIGCIVLENRKAPKLMEDNIQISGYFYKHIPYYIYLPKHMNNDIVGITSKYIKIDEVSYSSKVNTFRFVIQEDNYSNIHIFNKKNGQTILDIKPKAKHPNIKISLNRYFVSGDTINISDFSTGGFAAESINFDGEFRFLVKEFDVIIMQNGTLKSYSSSSPYLTSEQINSIKIRDKHTPIIVTNIVVKSINEDVKADPLVFFVKNE